VNKIGVTQHFQAFPRNHNVAHPNFLPFDTALRGELDRLLSQEILRGNQSQYQTFVVADQQQANAWPA